MTSVRFSGIDTNHLHDVLDRGTDASGNPIEPFIDSKGGWPLRCCLADSIAGDELAIIAWSPYPWRGPYAETGPVVVHAAGCHGYPTADELPAELNGRPMVLRPYGFDQHIAYHRVRHVEAGDSLTAHVEQLLAEADVDFVQGRNVTGGCYAFTATVVDS